VLRTLRRRSSRIYHHSNPSAEDIWQDDGDAEQGTRERARTVPGGMSPERVLRPPARDDGGFVGVSSSVGDARLVLCRAERRWTATSVTSDGSGAGNDSAPTGTTTELAATRYDSGGGDFAAPRGE